MFNIASPIRSFWIRLFVAVALVGGLTTVYIYGVINIQSNWAFIESTHQTLQASDRMRIDILAGTRAIDRLGDERNQIAGVFSDPANPLPLIESIEGLGSRLGVTTNIALTSSSDAKSGQLFSVTASGSFPAVMKFFSGLESLPYLVDFGDADIRQASVQNLKPPVESNVALTIVLRPLVLTP